MKSTVLYIKESPLGLKYLGKTSQDPHRYKGSGKYWVKHLAKHALTASDIKTTILLETTNPEELRRMGLYFSELYNVVNSPDWANLKEEVGDGGGGKKDDIVRAKIRNTMKGRQMVFSQEVIDKRNQSLKGRKMPPCKEETKKKISEANKGRILGTRSKESSQKSIETRKQKEIWHSEETKEKIRQTLLGRKRPSEVVEKMGKPVIIDGIPYSSLTVAERVLGKTKYFLRKHYLLKTE